MQILVIEDDVEQYRTLLADLPHDMQFCVSVPAATTCDALLASPDRAGEFLRAGGRSRWIQSTWAGVKPLLDAMKETRVSIPVTGVKGIFGPLIGEYVFAYLLDDARKLTSLRTSQSEKVWQPQWPETLQGRHMVVLGTGSIARHVAGLASAFRMRTTGVSRSGAPTPGFDQVVPVGQLVKLLPEADYLLMVLPETAETSLLVGEEALAALPSHAMLLNVGRGSTLDEEALIHALRRKQIRRAVLDVFAQGPLPTNHPLWKEPGVDITPHISAVSFPEDIAKIFRRNLELFRAGQLLQFLVDPEKGY